jgi:hypothetical protein
MIEKKAPRYDADTHGGIRARWWGNLLVSVTERRRKKQYVTTFIEFSIRFNANIV